MTKRQIWLYGAGMFVLVLAVALVVSLTQNTTIRDIGKWEPIPVSTLSHTPTPTSGWWDEKPTPPFSSQTLTPTLTTTPNEEQ